MACPNPKTEGNANPIPIQVLLSRAVCFMFILYSMLFPFWAHILAVLVYLIIFSQIEAKTIRDFKHSRLGKWATKLGEQLLVMSLILACHYTNIKRVNCIITFLLIFIFSSKI